MARFDDGRLICFEWLVSYYSVDIVLARVILLSKGNKFTCKSRFLAERTIDIGLKNCPVNYNLNLCGRRDSQVDQETNKNLKMLSESKFTQI